MSLFNLLSNTIEGTLEVAANTVKLAAAPVTNLTNIEEDHFDDAMKGIEKGVQKIGNSEDD